MSPSNVRIPQLSLAKVVLLVVAGGITASFAFSSDREPGDERFGPYVAIAHERDIVPDVKVDEEGNVFLKVASEFLNESITVKISMQNGAGYRKWFTTGTEELVSPAFAGKEPGGWSDRVKTTANYIEYWMGGKLILHLHRVE
jgi:hypothetical protein